MATTGLEALKQRWREIFRQDPPFRARVDFMQGHIDWAVQAKVHGGLKRSASAELRRLISGLSKGCEPGESRSLLIKPGTKLIRDYQGEQHEVLVVDKGFLYHGAVFSSLSRIARHITGTRWNGKVFFGLKTL